MTTSGAWLPARMVMEAAKIYVKEYEQDLKDRIEEVVQLHQGEKTLRFKHFLPYWHTRTREEIISKYYASSSAKYFLENPRANNPCAAMLDLGRLAKKALEIDEGCTVFVSSDDFDLLQRGKEKHESWFAKQ